MSWGQMDLVNATPFRALGQECEEVMTRTFVNVAANTKNKRPGLDPISSFIVYTPVNAMYNEFVHCDCEAKAVNAKKEMTGTGKQQLIAKL